MAGYAEVYRGANINRTVPPQPMVPGNFRRISGGENGFIDPHHAQTRPHPSAGVRDNRSNIDSSKLAIHRPRLNRKQAPGQKPSSSLTTKFDPMKDRHMWAMWRTAVNGRIVDQVKRNEQFKFDTAVSEDASTGPSGETRSSYGKDLASAPPLSRFIHLNESSQDIAQTLMSEGHGQLQTKQFIYYGLPRVTINSNIRSPASASHFRGSDASDNHTDDNGSYDGNANVQRRPKPDYNPYYPAAM